MQLKLFKKKIIQKTTEGTDDPIRNIITNKITKVLKSSPKSNLKLV